MILKPVHNHRDKPDLILYCIPKSGSTSLHDQLSNFIIENDSDCVFSIEKQSKTGRLSKHTSVFNDFLINTRPDNLHYQQYKRNNFLRGLILIKGGHSILTPRVMSPKSHIEEYSIENFLKSFKIINVRNPYGRLYSMWTWHNKWRKTNASSSRRNNFRNNFSSFVEDLHRNQIEGPGFKAHSLIDLPQYAYSCIDNLGPKYDFVFKIEEYARCWSELIQIFKDKYGICYTKPDNLNHTNKNTEKDEWKKEFRKLNQKTLEKSIDLCKIDSKLFGYELDLS